MVLVECQDCRIWAKICCHCLPNPKAIYLLEMGWQLWLTESRIEVICTVPLLHHPIKWVHKIYVLGQHRVSWLRASEGIQYLSVSSFARNKCGQRTRGRMDTEWCTIRPKNSDFIDRQQRTNCIKYGIIQFHCRPSKKTNIDGAEPVYNRHTRRIVVVVCILGQQDGDLRRFRRSQCSAFHCKSLRFCRVQTF